MFGGVDIGEVFCRPSGVRFLDTVRFFVDHQEHDVWWD